MTVVLGVARRGILLVTLMLSGSVSTLAQVDDIDAGRRMYREGILPSGEPFTAIVAGDVPVLGTLSSGNSPGVDDSAIRFATVFTQDVDVVEREAVLAVSNTFAEVINRQTRLESERWDRGYTPESRLPTVFREWIIEEWTLSGPPESWSGQLESYYQQQPIFAMLGGLGTGSWRPVSDFCEQQEIPCLFPGTDSPLARDGDFYTLYFFRGLVLEADLIAAHLSAGRKYVSSTYPRATLGPGQRFLSKGGYVLPITDGRLETAEAEWILP